MDIPPPLPAALDQAADFAASPLFARMLEDLADALPPRETDTPARAAQRHEHARAMVLAAHPRDPIEAAMAITAAIAYQASLANNTLAASPGLTSVQSSRYARIALAQQRAFLSGIAALDRHRATARPTAAKRTAATPERLLDPEAPRITEIPRLSQFQPRDRYGNPIKLHRSQEKTKKQVDATYGDHFDKTALWQAAIEEEEIAIAGQQAIDDATVQAAQSRSM
jgi:hypothetical protein